MNTTVDRITLVGRDVPLWLAACVLRSAFGPSGPRVTAIELPSALRAHDACVSLPALEALHHRLRIDEATLLGAIGGSFSLGQNFVDTSRATPSFFHAYGSYGAPIEGKAFLPFWLMARRFGLQAEFEDFSLTAAAAKHGRMLIPDAATEIYGRTDYAYHLPAIEYSRWLKQLALRRGVVVETAGTARAVLDPGTGAIAAIDLGDDRRIGGQLFVDATGERADLLSGALGVGRESWRDAVVADGCLAAVADPFSSIPSYADIRVSGEGWTGLYPHRARTHVVHVYSGTSSSDEQALQAASAISGLHLHDASVRISDPGRRQVALERNCIALGAAACSFDAAHSVDLHALQMGLVHLVSLFPVSLFPVGDYAAERTEYNRIMQQSYERIRDLQSAWYVTNRYPASGFWSRARDAARSQELDHKIDTFRARGDVPLYENESFALESWQSLFIGNGVIPESFDPLIERTPPETMKQEFRRILGFIREKVQEQTTHDFYLQSVCAR